VRVGYQYWETIHRGGKENLALSGKNAISDRRTGFVGEQRLKKYTSVMLLATGFRASQRGVRRSEGKGEKYL